MTGVLISPTGEMLPVDSKTYKSEEDAKAAMDGKVYKFINLDS